MSSLKSPLAIRHSPRLNGIPPASGSKASMGGGSNRLGPHASPTFANITVDSLFASPPFRPLQGMNNHHQHNTNSSSTSSNSSVSTAAVPSSITPSPLITPVNAMSLLKSLNNHSTSTSGATRSRRGSLAPPAQFDEIKGGTLSSGHILRSNMTSPTIPTRSSSNLHHFSSPTASPAFNPYDTPSIGGVSGSKSRFAHGFSSAKPFHTDASPFLGSRRSPRLSGHSPFPSNPFGSPSPGLGASLSQSQSPNISFALSSPPFVGLTPSLTAARLGDRGEMNHNHHHSMLGTSSYQQHAWERDDNMHVRRSPRFTPSNMPLSSSRRSPSFTMFSPPAHAQQPSLEASQAHHTRLEVPASGSGSSARRHHNAQSQPMLTTPINSSTPNSPNLSILGRLRSLNHQHGSGSSGSMSGEGEQPTDHLQLDPSSSSQHQQRSSSPLNHHSSVSNRKRSRPEYESESPFQVGSPPYSYHHSKSLSTSSSTPHFGSGTPYGVSPAMVGSLPPQHHLNTLVDVPAADMQSAFRSPIIQPKRVKTIKVTPRPRLKPEEPNDEHLDEDTAQALGDASTAGNGSGSSCHQCKSRRLIVDLVYCCNMWKKGKDRKVAPTATSSAAHSCRKKYCGSCLQKFYNERAPLKRNATNSEFVCPACRGICCCAACRRIKARQLGEIDPTTLSPASMLAYSYVYCPDVLLSSMGSNDQDGTDESPRPSHSIVPSVSVTAPIMPSTSLQQPPPSLQDDSIHPVVSLQQPPTTTTTTSASPLPIPPPTTTTSLQQPPSLQENVAAVNAAAVSAYYFAAAQQAFVNQMQQQAQTMVAQQSLHTQSPNSKFGKGKGKGKRASEHITEAQA